MSLVADVKLWIILSCLPCAQVQSFIAPWPDVEYGRASLKLVFTGSSTDLPRVVHALTLIVVP